MEVLKAIISLAVTVMLFVVLRLRFSARQFRRTVERDERSFNQQRDNYSKQSSDRTQSRSSNPDIIDVEFTEEEID